MKITLLGAAGGEVTGSCYHVESPTANLLVDCGLFQGGPNEHALNVAPLGAAAAQLNAVVLTHAHLDHTGRLPLLVKNGFRGPIFATQATIEMTGLILRDSAKIQAQDAARHAAKPAPKGPPPPPPLYSMADVEKILGQLKPVSYNVAVPVAPGVRACWVEAGHMLGSASIQLLVDDAGAQRRVVFSGDLGPKNPPILRTAEPFTQADLLFLESTYGDRDHQPFPATVEQFVAILRAAEAGRGKVLVPTFAIGRAQLLIALLAWSFRKHRLAPLPVFLDSPMAIEAGNVYDRHPELYDDEMVAFLKERPLWRDLTTMRMTATPEESKQINFAPGPCIVMAGSGMCTAGRIVHHLRLNLAHPEAHVLIAGFQGRGTLGRQLVDGAKSVVIMGETISVKAQIHTLGGFSAHAGQTDLLQWFSALAPSRPRVALTHGEDGPRQALSGKIAAQYGITPVLPALGQTVTL
jgi:metallo-beta-lactamase family protein